jgi:hypothetical protein
MENNTVSWEEFETHYNCPLWWNWSHLDIVEERNYTFVKDIQHVVRGKATQTTVDRWVREEWWKLPDDDALKLWEEYLPISVEQALEEGKGTGESKATKLDLWLEIRNNLTRMFPALKSLLVRMGGEALTGIKVNAQETFTGKHPLGINISATSDLVIRWGSRLVIIEGRSTHTPRKATNHQIRWQIDCAKMQGLKLLDSHYYAFYHTGQLWEVKITDPENDIWERVRDNHLQGILESNINATPSPDICRRCPHNRRCTVKHVPKVRETEAPVYVPKQLGLTTLE